MTMPGEHSVVRTRRLVGRARERELLRHLLDDAANGRPAIVVITGVPGSGKSALLGWLHEAAAARGSQVLHGSAYESAQPFDVLRRMCAPLRGLQARLGRAGVRGPSGDGHTADACLGLLAEVAVDELGALGRRRPTVLLVDDTQDVDQGSRVVLEQVISMLDDTCPSAGSGANLLIALAARDPTPPDGLAAWAVRHDACRTIVLGGLDEHEIRDLLTGAGLTVTPGLVSDVLEATGGLPLLVEADAEMRQARRSPGASALNRNLRVRSITDAIQARLARVDVTSQRLLAAATVLGEPWDPEELAAIATVVDDDVATRLDLAEQADLVEALGDGTWRFAHPVVRTELLSRLGPATQRALHRAIAEHLARSVEADATPSGDDRITFRMADHLVRAWPGGEDEQLVATVWEAGRRALRWGAFHQASRLLSVAVSALPEAACPAQRARLLADAGDAAYLDHDPRLCHDHLVAAIELAEACGDGALRLRAAAQLVLARNGSGETQVGLRANVSELEAALADPTLDPTQLVDGVGVLADALLASGESERALDLVAEARLLAEKAERIEKADTADSTDSTGGGGRTESVGAFGVGGVGIDDAIARLEFSEGIHRMVNLDLVHADECFRRGLAHAADGSNPAMIQTLHGRRALVALLEGHVQQADGALSAIVEETLRRRFWGEAGLASTHHAAVLALLGRAAASEAVDRAAQLYRRTGFTYVGSGLVPVAAALESRTQGWSPTNDGLATRLGLPPSSAVAVLSSIEADDVATVRAQVRTSSWRHGFRGRVTLPGLTVLTAMVEAGDRLGSSDLVVAARGALTDAYQAGVVVVATWPTTVPRLLAMVDRHAGDLGAARYHLDHAFALCVRQSLATDHPKVLLELARVEMVGGGERATAEALLAGAVDGFDSQGMHGWIARCEAVAHELGLGPTLGMSQVSVRERTIFTNDIVGSTRTNARLGDALYLEQLRKHDRIIRSAIQRYHGLEIKHTGDGINATFDHSADALTCAATVQCDFASWKSAEPDLALSIRCGLSRGRLLPNGGDFFGLVQSEAARLCSMADAGEVLASASVVDDAPDTGFSLHPLGPHQLRGLPAMTAVYRLIQ